MKEEGFKTSDFCVALCPCFFMIHNLILDVVWILQDSWTIVSKSYTR